jgi:hypothetical protein
VTDDVTRLVRRLDDLDGRLRAIEGGQRIGLASIRNVWGTAAVDATTFAPSTDQGPVGSTWEDDEGNTGTGYPEIDVESGTRVLIEWNARPIGLATSASYRSVSVTVGLLLNGAVLSPAIPTAARQIANGNAAPVDVSIGASLIRTVPAGVNTYKIVATWGNDQPAAPNKPRLTDIQLMVTPLGFA